jgi:hypothetical protein
LIGLSLGLCFRVTLTKAAMSESSIYLRDQAAKCKWHANNMGDKLKCGCENWPPNMSPKRMRLKAKSRAAPAYPPSAEAILSKREDFEIPGFPQAEHP